MLPRADGRRDAAGRRLESWPQRRQLASGPHERGEPDLLCGPGDGAGGAKAPRLGEELAQGGAREPALRRGPTNVLHLRSPSFDDPSVRHPRRAHGLTCAAAEAEVDVARLVLGEGKPAAFPLRHEVDAPAR